MAQSRPVVEREARSTGSTTPPSSRGRLSTRSPELKGLPADRQCPLALLTDACADWIAKIRPRHEQRRKLLLVRELHTRFLEVVESSSSPDCLHHGGSCVHCATAVRRMAATCAMASVRAASGH